MNNSIEKFEKFRAEIESDSQKESQTLLSEAKKNAEESIAAKKESLRTAYSGKVARMTEKFRAEEKSRVSEVRFSEGRRVLAYRGELTDRFFAEIERELRETVASPAYGDYIKHCVERAHAYSPLGASVAAYCRAEDLPAVRRALAVYGVSVCETAEIRIGGLLFRYGERGAYADFTLDTALEKEREAFASQKEMQL